MNQNKRVSFKDIYASMKQIPKTLGLILRYEKKLSIGILLLSACLGFIPVISLYLSQELINSLIKDHETFSTIFLIFAQYISVSVLSIIISVILEYCQGKIQYKLQYKLNYLVMQKCAKLSLVDFENSKVYDNIEKITSEIAYKPYQIYMALISMVTAIITMISSVVFLMMWNVFLAMVLLIVPIFSLVYFLQIGEQEFQMHWKRAKDERKTWYLSYILTHDFSYKEINLYGIKDYILKKYWALSDKFIGQNNKILKKKNIFTLLYELVIQAISAVIVLYAIFSAFMKQILVGNVTSYIKSISLVQTNSKSIMGYIYMIYNSNLYMNMLFEFLNYKNDVLEIQEKRDVIEQIDIEHIKFKYPNGNKYSLNDVSLHFKKGQRVALVGPNGSGKSTLIKVLAGLYDLQDGHIKINNAEVNINTQAYQNQMTILFQDFVKYEMPLRENIGFGDISALEDEGKIKEVLDEVKADFLKQDQQYNLDMQLGVWFEGGRQLSQGQWQKIALARAYFRKASVYILDEPNAALDPISEKEVFDSFLRLSEDKIGIYVSHKLNAAKLADVIVVLENGHVVGVGSHDELMKQCPTYFEMYESENYGNIAI